MFRKTAAIPAEQQKTMQTVFGQFSRGHRSDRIPPRESPRRAHGTLQPQDESVIVGYYTSAEVHPRGLQCPYKLKIGGVLWQEAMALIAPAQEI